VSLHQNAGWQASLCWGGLWRCSSANKVPHASYWVNWFDMLRAGLKPDLASRECMHANVHENWRVGLFQTRIAHGRESAGNITARCALRTPNCARCASRSVVRNDISHDAEHNSNCSSDYWWSRRRVVSGQPEHRLGFEGQCGWSEILSIRHATRHPGAHPVSVATTAPAQYTSDSADFWQKTA
jgi:hypothetical protein